MTAVILDGKAMAQTIRAEIAEQVAQFTSRSGITPCLAAVLVGTCLYAITPLHLPENLVTTRGA